jgi:hypothetical protein
LLNEREIVGALPDVVELVQGVNDDQLSLVCCRHRLCHRAVVTYVFFLVAEQLLQQIDKLVLLGDSCLVSSLGCVFRVTTGTGILIYRVRMNGALVHQSLVDVAGHIVIEILELTLVFERTVLVDSFLEWLELEAIFPDKELEDHAHT